MSTRDIATEYRASATLPLRVEFVRQLRRRRTMVAYALVVALPIMVSLAVKYGSNATGPGRRLGSGSADLAGLAAAGAANFTVTMFFFAAGFLLLVIVALFCGDTVASEASWSSLRYLLAAPIPRQAPAEAEADRRPDVGLRRNCHAARRLVCHRTHRLRHRAAVLPTRRDLHVQRGTVAHRRDRHLHLRLAALRRRRRLPHVGPHRRTPGCRRCRRRPGDHQQRPQRDRRARLPARVAPRRTTPRRGSTCCPRMSSGRTWRAGPRTRSWHARYALPWPCTASIARTSCPESGLD